MHNENMVEGFPLIKSSEGECTGFLVRKHPEKRYKVGKERRVSSTFDLFHNDFSKPIPTSSMNVFKYFLTFIDDF